MQKNIPMNVGIDGYYDGMGLIKQGEEIENIIIRIIIKWRGVRRNLHPHLLLRGILERACRMIT